MNDKISKTKKQICNMDCFNCKFLDCINDYVKKERRWRDLPEEQKKKSAEHKREKYYRDKEKGICTHCGKKPIYAEKSTICCYECYINYKKRDMERYRELRARTQEKHDFKEKNNLCLYCDEPRVDGKKVCAKHYKKMCDRIMKANQSPKRKAAQERQKAINWANILTDRQEYEEKYKKKQSL